MRLSVQGVKSLVSHFACLCQECDFYKVKKKYYIITFQKEKENTFTLLIILILKSLQKEHRVFTLRKCIRLDLHTAGVSKNSQKYATNKSVEF